ncbi:putative leucine-rich repeat-containing protein DDB_G0290503 [Battus philenor]|uniref:putative leucine-rich repeat-containing protein DDB_G0290503 n=1 Tax=Battus philenor TaxID=42288 RepID=UPI0035CFB7F6
MEASPVSALNQQLKPVPGFTSNQSLDSVTKQKPQPSVSLSFQSENEKQKVDTNNKLVSTYQISHCNLLAPSFPKNTELSKNMANDTALNANRLSRVTHVANSFAESLRKYPERPQNSTCSTELIERILSATLSKRTNKTKKVHPLVRNKKNKCSIEHHVHKSLLQTRGRRLSAAHHVTKVDPKVPLSSTRASMTTPPTTLGLSETPPRVQRMGRGAEVRYINDVRKCIRDAIRHVWSEDNSVCPEIQRRFEIHQKEYHNPRKSTNDVCCFCQRKLPCRCQMKTTPEVKEDTPKRTTRSFLRCLKFRDQSTSLNDLNTVSCCDFCREEKCYYKETFDIVNDWLQEIPVNANCSNDDKAKRQTIIKKLVHSLLKCKGVEERQKEEIKKCLNVLPMWQPSDQNNRDALKNNLTDSLMNRLKTLTDVDVNSNDIKKFEQLEQQNQQSCPETSGNAINKELEATKGMVLDAKIKEDLKKIIEITKNNCLDSRTESLLMEALLVKLKALSTQEPVQKQQNSVDRQNVQGYLEKKVSQVLEELPVAVGNNVKKIMKDEIMEVIFRKLDTGQTVDSKSVNENGINELKPNIDSYATMSMTQFAMPLKEEIQDYVKEHVASMLHEFALDLKDRSKIQDDLTNIMADQIVRGDNENKFKEKAQSLLQEIDLSDTKIEDLYNIILRKTNDITLGFKNKTLPLFNNRQRFKQNTEKEIINFITDIIGGFDINFKKQVISSTKQLSERIENIIANVRRSSKEKEELVYKEVFNFLKSKGLPTDGRCKKFATKLTKRLLNIPPKASTMRRSMNESYFQSPTLSSIGNDESLNILDQGSLVQIYESISMNVLSQEVLKCIEKIPPDRVTSQDKNYHKIVAKEIAKQIRNASNQSYSSSSLLERTVFQWLPKLIKEPHKSEINMMKDDLRRIMEGKISPKTYSIYGTDKYVDTLKGGITEWMKNMPMYQVRNAEEKMLQRNLVSSLANELNRTLNDLSSSQQIVDEEAILRIIENRVKQFSVGPEVKHDNKKHREAALELLNHLKQMQLISNVDNLSLNVAVEEILKWMDKIPAHRIISNDRNYQKMMAQEIEKRITEKLKQSSNPDLVFEREVLQWLPKILKEPDESETRLMIEDLKKVFKQKPFTPPRYGTDQLNESLKDGILGWLKNTQIYQRRNTKEKLFQENLMSELVTDITRICNDLPKNGKGDVNKLILRSIEAKIKQLPLDPKMKQNDEYHNKIALELFNHLKVLEILENIPKENRVSTDTIKSWLQTLPLKLEMDSQEINNFAENVKSILCDYLNDISQTHTEKRVKKKVINTLKNLPLHDDIRENSLQKLVDDLFAKLKNTYSNEYSNLDISQSLAKEVAVRCEKLALNIGNKAENVKKIEKFRENLVRGLVDIINKINENTAIAKDETLFENMVKDEIEELLNRISVNEHLRRNSIPLVDELVNITKELSKIERRNSAEGNYKKHLRDIIDKTLPSTPDLFSERRNSFENMKDDLVEAFVGLLKNKNGNVTMYKRNVKEEINNFCNNYLKRYPSTPIDVEKLCDNLYTALQNVPVPESKDPDAETMYVNIKDEVENCLAALPLKYCESNSMLKEQFLDFLLNISQTQVDDANLKEKIMEKLNEFSFEAETAPNLKQVTKDIVNILKNPHRTSIGQTKRHRKESLARSQQGLQPQVHKHLNGPFCDCISSLRYKDSVTQEDGFLSPHSSNFCSQTLTPPKRKCCQSKEDEDVICNVPNNFVNCLNRTAPKRKKSQGSQTSKICDLSPCIIVKEYYWDPSASCQMDSSLQEVHSGQCEPRRTVPSLPLTQTKIPCSTNDLPTGLCRSMRRLCVQNPCQSHISVVDPRFTPLPVPMNQQTLEEEHWATGKAQPNVRYKHRQSNFNMARNMDESDNFVSRTVSESKTQRRKICYEPCSTGTQSGDRCNYDFCPDRRVVEFETDQNVGLDADFTRREDENVQDHEECTCSLPKDIYEGTYHYHHARQAGWGSQCDMIEDAAANPLETCL